MHYSPLFRIGLAVYRAIPGLPHCSYGAHVPLCRLIGLDKGGCAPPPVYPGG
jgi:hypothetical protein